MKKFLNIFFVTLGVIFFLLILAVATFFFVDPWNLRPLLFDSGVDTEMKAENIDAESDKHPALNAAQEKTLETFGVDPAALPTEITSEQEDCFVEKLGAERVNEIKAGDTPSATEFFRAKDCI